MASTSACRLPSSTSIHCSLRSSVSNPPSSARISASASSLSAITAPALSLRASASPSTPKTPPAPQQAQPQSRGGKAMSVSRMSSAVVDPPVADAASSGVKPGARSTPNLSMTHSNGALTDRETSQIPSHVNGAVEILPSFVPSELMATYDLSEAFWSSLLELPVFETATSPKPQLEPATSSDAQEDAAVAVDGVGAVAVVKEAEVGIDLATYESLEAGTGYSKRMRDIGDELFESDLRPVVLFDGVCNLCNKWVNFLLDYDPLGNLRFASLQGESGRALLRRAGRDENDHSDIVFVAHNKAYIGSDAILEIFARLKPPFPLIALLGHVTPHALHEWIYKTVSSSRHSLPFIGEANACRLFDPRFAQRFLPSERKQE